VQQGVFKRNRQAKPCSATGAFSSWVGSPEPIKNSFQFPLTHANTLVGYSNRNCITTDPNSDRDGLAFTVLNCVGK
jgi:hypothetical protein